MTRRSYAAVLIDPRDRVLQQPRQFRQNWLIQGARIVFISFVVTLGAIALFLLDIATR